MNNLIDLKKSIAGGNSHTYVGFWRETAAHGYMSQWSKHAIIEKAVMFKTAEHYMMAQKALLFGDNEVYLKILAASHPRDVKDLGKQVKNFVGSVWDKEKYGIVLRGNMLKFTQHADIRESLLSTGDSVLVEASPYDRIWGIGIGPHDDRIKIPKLWKGENLLGFAIMEVRGKLNV